MGKTGKKGKLKKGDGGKTYSTTGTTLKDWGITDPSYVPPTGLPHLEVNAHDSDSARRYKET